MVTLAEEPDAPQTTKEQVAEAALAARDSFISGARYIVTGSPTGRIRRGVLYSAVIMGIVLDVALVSLTSVILLAWTDNVIEVPGA